MKQLAILMLMIVTLCGCSKDEDKQSTEQSIVGTWWHYESYISESDDTFDYRGENRLLVFDANSKYERFEDGEIDMSGEYKVSGNDIIMYDYNGNINNRIELKIRKIEDDYLEISWTYINSIGDRDTWINKYKRRL